LISVEVAGEEMIARADRTLYWPKCRTLFVADLHLGKGAAFRAGSIPVPEGSTETTLRNLSHAMSKCDLDELVILGDMWHSKTARDEGTRRRFASWRREHSGVEMLLVVGNHDVRSGPLEGEGFQVADSVIRRPFVLTHHPSPSADGYVLAGHIHPSVNLEGRGRQSLKLPCFWFGDQMAVLPSFGDFTGSATVYPKRGDTVLVIAEDKVIRISG
jgi:DNA ligase-associated metallophosphoesterase